MTHEISSSYIFKVVPVFYFDFVKEMVKSHFLLSNVSTG